MVRRLGEYETLEDAVAAAKSAIDEFLKRSHQSGMSAGQLFFYYQNFGETPFIFRDDAGTVNVAGFNHFEYAMSRSAEICAGN